MSGLDAVLIDHPFLAGMSEEYVHRLAGCGTGVVVWDPGTKIFREGSAADACWLIDHGDVALQVHTPGSAPRTLQTLHDGDVLGWSWLFPPYRWSFDARAITSVKAFAFDSARLTEAKENDLAFGYELMRRFAGVVVDRLQRTRLQLLDLYGHDDHS